MQHDPALSPLDGFGLSRGRTASRDANRTTGELRPRLTRLASRAVLGLALLLLAAAASLYWFRSNYDNRVYPAISVGGLDVGGMNFSAAESALTQQAESLTAAKATFTYKNWTWQPSLADLGVSVDPEPSLAAAYEVGREDGAQDRIRSAWRLLRDDRSVPLAVTLDEETLNTWFDKVDADLGITPRDAKLVVKNGLVSIEPEVAGTVVNRADVRQALVASLSTLQPPVSQLPVIDKVPSVSTVDLSQAQQQLEQALSKPVKVSYQRESWSIPAVDLGEFFVQTTDETKSGPAAIGLTLDRKALAKYLSKLVGNKVNHDPVDAVVGWNGERLIAVEPSVDGAKIKPTTFADAVIASFFGDHANVEIPVATIKPKIDGKNLGALGITTRLAVGSSNFEGSDEGRATNIRVGANILNGQLIPPHTLFSFNHAIDVISTDAGFVESNVVDGERIGRDVGGGICQVSTTMFRAAFYAGLPIDEWHPHRYRMRFYEQDDWTLGLDASILQPEGNPFGGGDFTFWNPTDSYILIESYVDGPRVVVVLYGPNLDYTVDVTGPVMGDTFPATADLEIVDDALDAGSMNQSEAALDGVDVTYLRDVYDKDGTLIDSHEFYSHFYPRGNVWKVSPDMAGQSPAANGGS